MPLASAYYVARLADAMGYQDRCPTNKTFLKELDIQTPWSGTHGAIAIGKIKYMLGLRTYFVNDLESIIFEILSRLPAQKVLILVFHPRLNISDKQNIKFAYKY